MALDFPNSPAVGEVFVAAGSSWLWDGTKWVAAPTGDLSTIVVSDSRPLFTNGGLWFDSANAQLFIGYDDGSSQQWIIANNTDSTTAGVDTWNGNSGDVVMSAADISAVMPVASTTVIGGVKVDGTTVTVDGTGKLSATMSSGVVSFNTRPGPAITLSSLDVTTALTFTPYNATNPLNYQTDVQLTAALAPKAPIASPTFTGVVTTPSLVVGSMGAVTSYGEGVGVIGTMLVARHVIAITATTVAAIPGPPPGTTSAVITMGATDAELQIGNGVFDMQPFIVRIDQGATPHAVTLGTSIALGIDTTSFVASGALKSDLIGFLWHAAKAKWLLTSVQHGF